MSMACFLSEWFVCGASPAVVSHKTLIAGVVLLTAWAWGGARACLWRWRCILATNAIQSVVCCAPIVQRLRLREQTAYGAAYCLNATWRGGNVDYDGGIIRT